ncbi:RusA-like Holliday junction resolvase [Escherichia phage Sortsne]|uniref:DNA polymerase III beta sliding clamp central domain-containing protein n=1 Tax=Escherichia phage Sortsne TaxID=2562456 RepID=A0A4D6DZ43_9CAUD|nr:RusA-like Holliday junction resolvase [Escherichia phage Sortsne]QBZ71582.1 hypothetical protein [Escherichia phage Sortsne]QHJ81014.1 MAG: hypothetical protein [Caudoviricetes sp.]
MIIYAPVEALRAHALTQAKNDVRYYLNAVHLKGNTIQSSNGHVALSSAHGLVNAPEEGVILKISTPPSGRAFSTAVIDTEAGIVYWTSAIADKPKDLAEYDFRKMRGAVGTVDVVDARYPDVDRLISGQKAGAKAITEIKVASEYLGLIEKLGKKFGAKMPFASLHFAAKDQPLRVEFETPCGPATFIIMPARG